jgi:hypothetical protein
VAALNYPIPAGVLEFEVLPSPQRIAEAIARTVKYKD